MGGRREMASGLDWASTCRGMIPPHVAASLPHLNACNISQISLLQPSEIPPSLSPQFISED